MPTIVRRYTLWAEISAGTALLLLSSIVDRISSNIGISASLSLRLNYLHPTLGDPSSPMAPTISTSSGSIIFWSYATNAILQIVDVIAWLHPPLLCPQARDPVAKMFVRGQSVFLAPLLIVFWLFRSVPLQQGEHRHDDDDATRVLTRIARGVAVSFVLFHGATVAWCAGEVYLLGTEMTKTHLIFCFHGFYAVAVMWAYRLSELELKLKRM